MSELTADELEKVLAGDPEQLDVHLAAVGQGISVAGCAIRINCHCLTVDANGRIKLARLAEYLRLVMTDYAIPKSKIAEAKKRDAERNSTVAVNRLMQEARALFTDLEKTGEGGEMLLYVLAQHFLKLPQVLCKMDLKTDSKMHYHGADGVYAGVTEDGVLKLYWGESKVYGDAGEAIRSCLASLAPFLVEEDSEQSSRERDLVLLSDKADLSSPGLTAAFKRYFDRDSVKSNRVRYCGIALAGFDGGFYPDDGLAVAADLEKSAKAALKSWIGSAEHSIQKHKLSDFEIELLCIPLPSADGFRKAFLKALGLYHDA